MNSVTQNLEDANYLSARIRRFFKHFKISEILRNCNAYKQSGISVVLLISYLFSLVFRGRSMNTDMILGQTAFKKDTVYRFQNSSGINWLRMTTQLSSRVIEEIQPLTSEQRRKVFIIDDSIVERERSKTVELLARVYDHAKRHKCVPGYRMLTLGWSDGASFVPVNSCMMSTENAENRLVPARELPKGSNGAKRREMAQKKMTEVVPELLKTAINEGIKAQYVLFDSWFSSPKEIAAVKMLGLDVVAMVKKSSRIRYEFQGEKLDCGQIYSRCKKRRGRSRYLLSVPITIDARTDKNETAGIPAKLVYIRNRNKKDEYLVLLTTDTALAEEEVIRLYARRWEIEVFFKACKSLLKLKGECQSLSYDAVCSHTAIVFMRYMFLAVEMRTEKDPRTMGPLFYLISNEMPEISVSDALAKLQLFMKNCLSGINLPEGEFCALFDKLRADLPVFIAGFLGITGNLCGSMAVSE